MTFYSPLESRKSDDRAIATSSMKRRSLELLAFCGVAFRVYGHALHTATSKAVRRCIANSDTWSPSSSFSWLIVYFAFNLALTIYNKLVLAGSFPFPYMLTAVHCLFGTLGSSICLKNGVFNQARLTQRETIAIGLFSGLYTINIIVSNVSLYFTFLIELIIIDNLSRFHFIKLFDLQPRYSS